MILSVNQRLRTLINILVPEKLSLLWTQLIAVETCTTHCINWELCCYTQTRQKQRMNVVTTDSPWPVMVFNSPRDLLILLFKKYASSGVWQYLVRISLAVQVTNAFNLLVSFINKQWIFIHCTVIIFLLLTLAATVLQKAHKVIGSAVKW